MSLEHRDSQPLDNQEFPQNPSERLEAILPAIGNHPGKQALILLLEDTPQTALELLGKLAQISKPFWNPGNATTYDYCRKSLIPIGLVAEESFIRSDWENASVGFSLTDAGFDYGQPIAAYILERSYQKAQEGKPYFWSMLGSTMSRSKVRAPFLRTKLLSVLSEKPQDWYSDPIIRNRLDLGVHENTINHTTNTLSQLGLVEKQAVNNEDPGRVKYQLIKPINPYLAQITEKYTHWSRKIFLPKIIEALSNNEPLSAIELARGTGSHEKSVHYTLNFLLNEGLIEPAQLIIGVRRDMETKMSQVKITRLGLEFANDLASIERALADGPEITEMRKMAENLKRSPEVLRKIGSTVIKEWLATSIVGKKKGAKERKNNIVAYIKQNGPSRPKELFKGLQMQRNTRLLAELTSEGKLIRNKTGKIVHYSLGSLEKSEPSL